MRPIAKQFFEAENCFILKLKKCYSSDPVAVTLVRSLHGHLITLGFIPSGNLLNRLIGCYWRSSYSIYARKLFNTVISPDVVIRTTMISAYSAAGDMRSAKVIFTSTPLNIRDVPFYNAMISAYAHNKDGYTALCLFNDMRRNGYCPDAFTLPSVLCGVSQSEKNGIQCRQLHCTIVKSGTGKATPVMNALVNAYVKSAMLTDAMKSFDEMHVKDELTWTTVITGYARNGDIKSARELFGRMKEKLPVVWNAMTSSYIDHGWYQEAVKLFAEMNLSRIELDEYSFTNIISGCAGACFLNLGKQVHAFVLRNTARNTPQFISVNNAFLNLYWKCGKDEDAIKVFDRMPERDGISWNTMLSGFVNARNMEEAYLFFHKMPMAKKNLLSWTLMISGFAQNGHGEDGLKLFSQMKLQHFQPCEYVFAGAIACAAGIGLLEHGSQLHAQLLQYGHSSNLSATNALITMYARCGTIEDAHRVFDTMPAHDAISWNAMIAAYGQHGCGVRAVEIFNEMLKNQILPDRLTFVSILCACSHAGLVTEGRHCFDSMHRDYGIAPDEDHCSHLIDLYSRAGRFAEACEIIESLPFVPGVKIWESLLSGCRTHRNMELAIKSAHKLLEMIPHQATTYITLSNMYALSGNWDETAKMRKAIRGCRAKKEPGCSWIEVERKVHVFLVDDAVHPDVQAIYEYLKKLNLEIRELGYVPDTNFVFHNMESGVKEHAVSTHSEKLAVSFGLMKLPQTAPVRVFKNLRICGDCHNAFKYISLALGRNIVVRDARRFHHFKNGQCSCGDYW